jgi:O-antigen/teichoic acid export membrane protein
MSLRQSVLRGSAWTIAGFGLSQVIRLGGNIALAAALYQEAFALMGITYAVITGLAMFSDLGLSPSVVQNRRGDDPQFLNTTWTVQILRGVVLMLAACVVAWPLAGFYAKTDPMSWELRWLLPLAALSTLIAGFNSSKVMTASRHMQLPRLVTVDLISQSLGLAVTVAGAFLTRSVYALVVGAAVTALTYCILSHTVFPGARNRLAWDPSAFQEILRFGKWVFVNTLLTFLALQLDKLMFAKLFTLDVVGVYGIASALAVMTPTLLSRLQLTIAFPLYSRMLDKNSKSLGPIVEQSKVPMLVTGGYLVALAIAGAHTFVEFAYDDRYRAAGLYIVILSAGAWWTVIEGIYSAAFLAIGRTRWLSVVNMTKVIVFCVLVVPAAKYAGIIGAVAAVAAADAAKAATAIYFARKIGLRNQTPEMMYTLYAAAVGFAVYWITSHVGAIAGLHPAILLVVQFLLVSIGFVPAGLAAWPRLHQSMQKQAESELAT